MKKIIAFAIGFVMVEPGPFAFFAFTTWLESPVTWDPASRFFVALMFAGIGIAAGEVAAECVE